jgi:antitoxin CcdA
MFVSAYHAHTFEGAAVDLQLSKPIPARATNITLSLDVYNAAKALGINLSLTSQRFPRVAIRIEKERHWAVGYANFIAAYNRDGGS